MFLLINLVLVIIALLFLLMSYFYFGNKLERLLMWSADGKIIEKVRDVKKYKRQSGIVFAIYGLIFLLIPFSNYVFMRDEFKITLVSFWIIILGLVVIMNAFVMKKNFK